MKMVVKAVVEHRIERYEGRRIRLIKMGVERDGRPDPHPIAPDTEGTCEMVDGVGHLVMKWDNGRTLSLIPGVDLFKIIE